MADARCLLNAHMDTVGVAGMEQPHEPRLENGRLYGRGAYDMKAGLAAAMLTAASCVGWQATLCWQLSSTRRLPVRNEGAAGLGLRADAAIVPEPTELDVAIAHKGFVGFEIETAGRAAHGSRPERGIDAIARMGPVLVELPALADRLPSGRSIDSSARARYTPR